MTGDSRAAINAVLDRLPTSDWTVFRDVPWPGRPHVSLPHVAIGPGGVFVIEGDTAGGRIVVKNDALRVHGRRRDGTLSTQRSAATAIGERLVTLDVNHVHGMVCFVSDDEVAGRAKGVLVATTTTLERHLIGQPNFFSPVRARSIAEDVRVALNDGAQPHLAEGWSRRRTTGVHRQRPSEHLRARSARRGARFGSVVLASAGLVVGMFALVVLASLWALFSGLSDTNPAAALDTTAACERVNANHPHGVGLPKARDKVVKGERRVKQFTVGKRLYKELSDFDSDDDGIVCEKR